MIISWLLRLSLHLWNHRYPIEKVREKVRATRFLSDLDRDGWCVDATGLKIENHCDFRPYFKDDIRLIFLLKIPCYRFLCHRETIPQKEK
ncbi:hypothetical protein CDAR_207421 [Caerostris darwini]|uniref:Uncharacterized protein n=1 Tax=Caerostris darwini TaxID=1538125 RepID=A0AAV4VGM9_9ARAC|nr:hypothetical protein CDAR_207421 [Caerostris darwini]